MNLFTQNTPIGGTFGFSSSRLMPDDGINLREEMNYLINMKGHPILLRRNYQIHCSCYEQSIYKDGYSECPYCCGTGMVNRIEKHYIRKIMTIGDRLMLSRLTDAPHSQMMIDAYKIYFMHYVNPKSQDIIYEVSWDNNGDPVALVAESVIIGVTPKRCDRGRLEFWDAHVRSRPFGKQIRNNIVRHIKQNTIDVSYPDSNVQYDLQW